MNKPLLTVVGNGVPSNFACVLFATAYSHLPRDEPEPRNPTQLIASYLHTQLEVPHGHGLSFGWRQAITEKGRGRKTGRPGPFADAASAGSSAGAPAGRAADGTVGISALTLRCLRPQCAGSWSRCAAASTTLVVRSGASSARAGEGTFRPLPSRQVCCCSSHQRPSPRWCTVSPCGRPQAWQRPLARTNRTQWLICGQSMG